MENLLEYNERGIYCPRADVYIDPWRPVSKALVTHGHSDHARRGHESYLCSDLAKPVLQHRLGAKMKISSIPYGESLSINGVNFSFHPAGHVIGSAQIRVEHRGEVWVASGDYKLQDDGISSPFEPVKCHCFITESTFGLPIYQWPQQAEVLEQIHDWWRANQAAGKLSIICCYSLGKAQRLVHNLDDHIGPIYDFGPISKTNAVIRQQGVALKETKQLPADLEETSNRGIVISTSAILKSTWLHKLGPFAVASASGWNMTRKPRWGGATSKGFILSDHADWNALNCAVRETGAERVLVTHGFSASYSRWLREQGLDARILETQYGEEGAGELLPDQSSVGPDQAKGI